MKHKHGDELPTFQSSGKCFIHDDALGVECCMGCIRRGRRKERRSWKTFRKTKYRVKDAG